MNGCSVCDSLLESAAKWPRRPAVRDEAGTLDFCTLAEHVDLAAKRFQQLGLGPGCGVALVARNSREFVASAFAIMRCGATLLPLSHQLAPAELADSLADSRVHAVVEDGTGADVVGFGTSSTRIAVKGLKPLRYTPTKVDRSRAFVEGVPEAAFVRYTSGTTGQAKGVVLTHQAMLERTAAANRGLELTAEDTVVWVLPMAFHFVVSILLYLRVGATIAVARDHLAETIIDTANATNGTFLYASPLHYKGLTACPAPLGFNTLRRAVSTSTGASAELAQAFQKRHAIPLTQAYGIIEVGLPLVNLRAATTHPEAVGHPLPDYDVAVLSETYEPLAPNQVGELGVRGPGMFAAYMNPARSRDEVTKNGWFLTGDLAQQTGDGLVSLVGRRKCLINVAGNKIFPEEVERVLERHASIRKARASARPHPRMGEVVHADVELVDEGTALDSEEIIGFCRRFLSSFSVPQSVSVVAVLETTASGKVRRW